VTRQVALASADARSVAQVTAPSPHHQGLTFVIQRYLHLFCVSSVEIVAFNHLKKNVN